MTVTVEVMMMVVMIVMMLMMITISCECTKPIYFRTSSLSFNYTTVSVLSPHLYHLKIESLSAIQKDLDVDTITFNILNVTYSDDDHITKNSIGQHNKVKYNTEYHIIIEYSIE